MEPKLILFDVDGTLIERVELFDNPWTFAFERAYGITDSVGLEKVDPYGKTHRQIIFEAMKEENLDEETIEASIEACFDELEGAYERFLQKGRAFLFTGIRDILEELSSIPNVYLGVITGNTERITFAKLKNAGIMKYFSTGGYGKLYIDRGDVVEAAINNAKARFSISFSPNNIFVLGDTSLDIKAANVHNVVSIGISTEVASCQELMDAGADLCLDGWQEVDKLFNIVS